MEMEKSTQKSPSPPLLVKWGEKGWIVAPKESAQDFVKRVRALRKARLSEQNFFQKAARPLSAKEWRPLIKKMQRALVCAPDWILAVYANRHLRPWHGAVTWIQRNGEGEVVPIIQLRTRFLKGKYLGYRRSAVLLHECIHVLRSAYPKSRFEEMLACSLGPKTWRQWLGPLFRFPHEVAVLIAFFGISFVSHVALYFALHPLGLFMAQWGFFAGGLYLLWRLAFLFRDWRLFAKALKASKQLFGKKRGFAVLLRLTDREIHAFATKEKKALLRKMKSQTCLRWKQIRLQFPLI